MAVVEAAVTRVDEIAVVSGPLFCYCTLAAIA